MQGPRAALLGAVVAVSSVGSFGCELVASVDRSKIPDDPDGNTGAAGTAGQGGAGVAGEGGLGAAGGIGAAGGLGGEGGVAQGGMGGLGGQGGEAPGGAGGQGGSGAAGGAAGAGGIGGDGGSGGGACAIPNDCPATGNECITRTCDAGVCGTTPVANGTPTAQQTLGDCNELVCNGAGTVVAANDDADLPGDANDCTDDVCTAGIASNPPKPAGAVCGGGGTLVCNGTGQCVGCVDAGDCSGAGPCKVDVCVAGACAVADADNGTACNDESACTQVDTCQAGSCIGASPVVCAALDSCHDAGVCVPATGTCTTPIKTDGTACMVGPLSGQCIAGVCVPPPELISITPAGGAAAVALPASIAVAFDTAMDPATLVGQTTAGACSGTVQVSLDDFATCIAFATATPAMSSGDTVATLTPAPGLLVNTTYRVRVTAAAESAAGIPLAAAFTQPTGFTTGTAPVICDGSLVISQVYGAGGNSGATHTHDFVELHNRGATSVSLAGMSVQYASAAGTTWEKVDLSGSIAPGGYFLVSLASGVNGAPLPAADATGSIAMSATNGKVALVASTVAQSGACPSPALTIDLVGYGSAACFEGSSAAPALGNTTAAVRAAAGCADRQRNGADFTAATPAPRNSASAAQGCACGVLNESNLGSELDYCVIQHPTSLAAQAGMATEPVFGRVYEAGVTEAAGASPVIAAQLGYGPVQANPQYDMGWQWFDASFNVQDGNNDEYQASFVAPAAGTYSYAYRFTLDGETWTVCDVNGAGSNSALGFTFAQLPTLTVAP